jgi:lipopolysaccharide biosynthesis glycosyltransferase
MTRYFKLFPHLFFKDYELSIYFDASYIINGDLNELLLRTLNPFYDLYFIQHPKRNNISQELSAVIEYKKDSNESVNTIRKKYIEENFPDNKGLTQNSIIIYNNKKA